MVLIQRVLTAALALPLAVLANPEAVPGAYIVEFDDSAHVSSDGFLSHLAANGVRATRRRDISSSLFRGVSFTLHGHKDEAAVVERISSMPGISWISPVRSIAAPETKFSTAGDSMTWDIPNHLRARQTDENEVVHQMTGVDKLRDEGYVGTGIKVAVVDSGIDYTHPALGGCFGEGCLVSFGADLVGDDFSSGIKPDADPFSDCHGHGTHVAGLVAAQSNPYGFTGVAPNATLGAYRVLDCLGRGTTDIFIDAFARAYDDGADVITASLGSYSGWSEEPWGVLISRIAAQGVPCLVAVGNDGSYGSFYASDGADGKGATGVGSINQPLAPIFLTKASYNSRNSSDSPFGWTPATGTDFANGTYPVYSLSLNSSINGDACDPLPASIPNLSNNVVLARRGGCSFNIKAQNIATAGGKMVLFYNNEPGTYEFGLTTEGINSAGMIPQTTGEEWVRMIATGASIEVNMVEKESAGKLYKVEENTAAGGFPSYFSNWGPTNELALLPTVLGPGSFMMSTWPLALGGYAVESGTSMSTPYIAGCIALLLEAKGKIPVSTINALLSTNGDPNMFHDGKTGGYPWLAPTIQQGGGLVNIYDAVHATTFVNVSSISFNDTDHQSVQAFTVRNAGSETVSFTLGNVGAGTVYALPADGSPVPSIFNYGDFPEMSSNYAQITFSPSVAVVPQGETVTIQVSASMPLGLNESRIPIYNGYLTLNGTNGDSLSVPYLGVASSMKDAVILDTERGENYLFSSVSYDPIQSGHTFHLPAPNSTAQGNYTYPYFSLRLSMGSRLVRVDVQSLNGTGNSTDVSGERVVGSLPNFPKLFQPRDAVRARNVRWNGDLSDGSFVPEGGYKLLVRALKIFGNPEDPEDYDVVETPPFYIRYARDVKRSLGYRWLHH